MNRYNLTKRTRDSTPAMGKKYYCHRPDISMSDKSKGKVFEIDGIFEYNIQLYCKELDMWDQCLKEELLEYYEPI